LNILIILLYFIKIMKFSKHLNRFKMLSNYTIFHFHIQISHISPNTHPYVVLKCDHFQNMT